MALLEKDKKSIKSYLKPKTFFDELAELGFLEEFLQTRFKDIYDNNQEFRDEMNDILFHNSQNVVTTIEILYLEKLCENMQYFLEYTKQWRIQKQ